MSQEELRRKQTYRRNRPHETKDNNWENNDPAEPKNDDPAEPENDEPVDPVHVTDDDADQDEDGQNNNSDTS